MISSIGQSMKTLVESWKLSVRRSWERQNIPLFLQYLLQFHLVCYFFVHRKWQSSDDVTCEKRRVNDEMTTPSLSEIFEIYDRLKNEFVFDIELFCPKKNKTTIIWEKKQFYLWVQHFLFWFLNYRRLWFVLLLCSFTR